MKLNFTINEDYLIAHTLVSIAPGRFSSKKHKKDIISFQNFAWKKSEKCYNFLAGRIYPEDFLYLKSIKSAVRELPNFLLVLKKNKYYKKILIQTKDYLDFCGKQWDGNYQYTSKIIKELTGFNLNKKFTVYITHENLKNGCFIENDKIAWGHNEDWPNYSTVYLWHEILHSYFKSTNVKFSNKDIEHSIIQLITDNELRIRLNDGQYPPFKGHPKLFPLMKKILPYWKKYLRSEKKNILEFRNILVKL
ncbi:hypothetical protein D4R42_05055 [bacterium]|nr:MAG: hypothetical protein D4R42_05055 [bacterium]